jgi:NAD dependent epimerase/dehydratase family enzyme
LSWRIFITGGTGHMGSRLIPLLAERGHAVVAMVREGSEHKLSAACTPAQCNYPAAVVCAGCGILLALRTDPVLLARGKDSATREGARRLGLVTVDQILRALAEAVEHPDLGVSVIEVPAIRAA